MQNLRLLIILVCAFTFVFPLWAHPIQEISLPKAPPSKRTLVLSTFYPARAQIDMKTGDKVASILRTESYLAWYLDENCSKIVYVLIDDKTQKPMLFTQALPLPSSPQKMADLPWLTETPVSGVNIQFNQLWFQKGVDKYRIAAMRYNDNGKDRYTMLIYESSDLMNWVKITSKVIKANCESCEGGCSLEENFDKTIYDPTEAEIHGNRNLIHDPMQTEKLQNAVASNKPIEKLTTPAETNWLEATAGFVITEDDDKYYNFRGPITWHSLKSASVTIVPDEYNQVKIGLSDGKVFLYAIGEGSSSKTFILELATGKIIGQFSSEHPFWGCPLK